MKKIILTFIGVLLALIIGLGLYIILGVFGIRQVPTESALPSGAIAYMRVNNLRSYQTAFIDSAFFKKIQGVDVPHLVEGGLLTKEQAGQIDVFRSVMTNEELWDGVEKFFGQQTAVAVYPFDVNQQTLQQFEFAKDERLLFELVQSLFGNIIMTTKVGKDVQAVEQLWRNFGEAEGDFTKESFDYNGFPVQKLVIKNTPMAIYYVRKNDLIAFTIGEQAIKNVVDVIKRAREGLTSDARLTKSGDWNDSGNSLYGYVDFEYFLNKFKQMSQDFQKIVDNADQDSMDARVLAQKENYARITQNLNRANGLKTLSVAFQHPGAFVIDSNLNFNESELDAAVQDSYLCGNARNRTADFTPDGVLGYYWGNCFDADNAWRQMKQEWRAQAGRAADALEKIRMLEQAWGLSLEEDILPVIGSEMGGYLADIQTGGLFPVPELNFFLKVNDPQKFEDLFAPLLQSLLFKMQDEDYQGVAIKYIALPLGQVLEPGYCFLDGYLLVATSRKGLKVAVDTFKGNKTALKEDALLADAGLDAKKPARVYYFLRNAAFLDKLQKILDWGAHWVGVRDKQREAFKAGAEQRIRELAESIAEQEALLEKKKGQALALEGAMDAARRGGFDVQEKEDELVDLQEDIKALEAGLRSDAQQHEQISGRVEKYSKKVVSPEERSMILQQVINPLLDAFKALKVIGSYTVKEPNRFNTKVIFK